MFLFGGNRTGQRRNAEGIPKKHWYLIDQCRDLSRNGQGGAVERGHPDMDLSQPLAFPKLPFHDAISEMNLGTDFAKAAYMRSRAI
jgi:hypothetical protein